jgi:hypothetical protein
LTIIVGRGFLWLRNHPLEPIGDMNQQSKYPEAAPSFPTAGRFTAWCAVSADRDFSAVAWRIQPIKDDDGSAIMEKKRSSGESSVQHHGLQSLEP